MFRSCSHCAAKLLTSVEERRIGQHAPHLRRQHRAILQLSLLRSREQLFVGNAAPQEERQPRGELEVANPIGGARGRFRSVAFDAEEELRIDENAGQRLLDAAVKRPVPAPVAIKRHQRLDVVAANRPAEGAAREPRKNRRRAFLVFVPRGM